MNRDVYLALDRPLTLSNPSSGQEYVYDNGQWIHKSDDKRQASGAWDCRGAIIICAVGLVCLFITVCIIVALTIIRGRSSGVDGRPTAPGQKPAEEQSPVAHAPLGTA